MPIDFYPYQDQDFDYCNSLIESNMEEYFAAADVQWDRNRYAKEIEKGIVKLVFLDEERVGFVHLGMKGKNAYVHTIQLSPLHRNRGIGSQILHWIQDTYTQKGISSIQLCVYKNSPALGLYERFGYGIEEDRGHKYLMKKDLSFS